MKALLADDDLISRMALTDLVSVLRQLQVVEVADGTAAWAELDNGLAPVICFFDVQMPGLDGLELLRRLRCDPRFVGIPVMLITSSADRYTVLAASKLGVDGFVAKPLDTGKTLERIELLVARFEREILDELETTTRRLGIKPERYAQYLGALIEQAERVAISLKNAHEPLAIPLLDGLRSAALTLAARHMVATIDRLKAAITKSEPTDSIHSVEWASAIEVSATLLRDRARSFGVRLADRPVPAPVQEAMETITAPADDQKNPS